jgi:hypothetical protein
VRARPATLRRVLVADWVDGLLLLGGARGRALARRAPEPGRELVRFRVVLDVADLALSLLLRRVALFVFTVVETAVRVARRDHRSPVDLMAGTIYAQGRPARRR